MNPTRAGAVMGDCDSMVRGGLLASVDFTFMGHRTDRRLSYSPRVVRSPSRGADRRR